MLDMLIFYIYISFASANISGPSQTRRGIESGALGTDVVPTIAMWSAGPGSCSRPKVVGARKRVGGTTK